MLLSPGWGPSQQCPVVAGLLRCPWAVGCSRMLLAGRLQPCGHAAWGLWVDRVFAWSPAAWLPSCGPLLPANAKGRSSPLLLPWCSIQPGQRVGSFPALLEGRSSWRAVSWLCLERSEWPPACLGEQLPCRRIAGIPAEQSQLSTADCALLHAQLPHSLPWWSGTGLVTSAQPGTDPFSRGLPVFHNRPLCPDPSRRPDQYLRSQPPALAEGATLQLPPASSPPAPPCPLSLPPHPAPWLPARCLIRCDLCRACISR